MDSPEITEKDVEKALTHAVKSSELLGTAYQTSPALKFAAAQLASTRWLETAKSFGFGRAFVGADVTRAVGVLASHQNAQLVRLARGVIDPQLLAVAENARRTVAQFGGIAELARNVELAVAPLRAFRESFNAMAEAAARFAEQQEEIDEALPGFVLRHGWPVPLTLSLRAYAHIVGMKDRPKREVTASMVYWFRPGSGAYRDCVELLLERPILESRRPLIKQVLRAHRRGDHYLVINGLLPLVEGVLTDAAFANVQQPRRNRVGRSMAELQADAGGSFDSALAAIENLVVAGAAGMGLFTPTDPADYGGRGEPWSLNRHAILHGYARRYSSEANALRMLLLLTVIAQVVDRER